MTVPTITFPTITSETASWLKTAQTSTRLDSEQARVGTISVLGSNFRRICNHGTNEVGWWFDDTIISAYMHLLQKREGARVRALSMVATAAILRGDLGTAEKEYRTRRDNRKLAEYEWIFLVFNIKSPQGRDLHWTLGGCNVDSRCIGYYDFGQTNRDSNVHLPAMQRFVEVLATSDAGNDDRPWHCVLEGTATMERPSVCLMADALVSGVPLTAITCDAVANSRTYRFRPVLVNDYGTGTADGEVSRSEHAQVRHPTGLPDFQYEMQTNTEEESTQQTHPPPHTLLNTTEGT